MKKLISALALVLCLSSPCFAQGVVFEQIIPVTSGTTVMVSVPDDVQSAIIQVTRGGACRMTFGKQTVSSTVGIYLALYGTYECKSRGEAVAAQFTVDSAGSGSSIYVIGYDYNK
jgi:hypothetical protein